MAEEKTDLLSNQYIEPERQSPIAGAVSELLGVNAQNPMLLTTDEFFEMLHYLVQAVPRLRQKGLPAVL